MALLNEKRYIIWNGDESSLEEVNKRIDATLAEIPEEYQDGILSLSNLFMDLGAAHYRNQVRMMVNGEAFAFLTKGENK